MVPEGCPRLSTQTSGILPSVIAVLRFPQLQIAVQLVVSMTPAMRVLMQYQGLRAQDLKYRCYEVCG